MQYVVSNQQMKEAERRCNESGTSYYQMMENAGTRCAEFILGTIPVSADIIRVAHTLIKKYQFQYFDALIVASALDADCNVLYSEDMQHGLFINNSLRIVNPFL